MIPTLKIRGLDFIGTEYEDMVWKIISESQNGPSKFVIKFHGETSDDVKTISESVYKNKDSLRIKTEISLSEKTKKDFVFLNITSPNITDDCDYRFQVVEEAPLNVIRGLKFMKDYIKHLSDSQSDKSAEKRQKRNDSSDFNYNKR